MSEVQALGSGCDQWGKEGDGWSAPSASDDVVIASAFQCWKYIDGTTHILIDPIINSKTLFGITWLQPHHLLYIFPLDCPLIMRSTSLLRALPSTLGAQPASLRPAPLALLPPIPLYRRILRSHRKHLPREMRVLGDEYVKAEFRAHRDTENPVHIVGFLTEWQRYAQAVEGDSWRGEKIDKGKVDKMSGEFRISYTEGEGRTEWLMCENR
jgi:hypothetical protein